MRGEKVTVGVETGVGVSEQIIIVMPCTMSYALFLIADIEVNFIQRSVHLLVLVLLLLCTAVILPLLLGLKMDNIHAELTQLKFKVRLYLSPSPFIL